MVRFEVSAQIDAPVDAVWAWWTDFGETGVPFRMKHGLGSSTRTIVARTGDTITFYDKSIIGNVRRDVRVNHAERMLHEIGSEGQQFESTWRFEAMAPAQTRVTRTMRVRAHPTLAAISQWITRKDLEFHCRDASRALGHSSES